jgi:D-cysteine desulfhydrase
MRLDDVPRLQLGHLPTPLDDAPRLAKELGLRRLLIKRDDLTGLGLGGNKVRKLEFLLAEALRQESDIILTDGGPQSNHARLTAAAARKIGLDSILFLGGPRFEKFDGNLLLDIVFGAEVRFMPDATVGQMESEMVRAADELREAGRKPFVISIGGSTPIGALGYVEAMRELAGQLGDDDDPQIVLAVGSGGTFAGVTLGTRLFLPKARVIGITVGRSSKPFQQISKHIAEDSAMLIGTNQSFDSESMEIYEDYLGDRYGIPTRVAIEAILLAARTDAIVLDPVYTGKAMSGLIDLAGKGIIDKDRTTIFLHTGGSPALFAYEEYFREFARYFEVV